MDKKEFEVTIGNRTGSLVLPIGTKALVIFVHGSGSNRFSSRNMRISEIFHEKGFGTFLVNLLTDKEISVDNETKSLRFDIHLLSDRLLDTVKWVSFNENTRQLRLGYFSSSTGTAAAINSLRNLGNIGAIVSRGGRTDLCDSSVLNRIMTPMLFVVGGKDEFTLKINKQTLKEMPKTAQIELSVIPGASHLFEFDDQIELLARLSTSWFKIFLLNSGDTFVNHYKPNSINLIDNLKSRFKIKFRDRITAGQILAGLISKNFNVRDVMIVGIPRGGLVIADVVAQKFPKCEFGVILVRRLRNPLNPEDSTGMLLYDGEIKLNKISNMISPSYLDQEITLQTQELRKQIDEYGLNDYRINCHNKSVILIDDGVFTGNTLLSVLKVIKQQKPNKIILAIPVISNDLRSIIKPKVDKIEFIRSPEKRNFVEDYYKDFTQIDEDVVANILKRRIITRRHYENPFS